MPKLVIFRLEGILRVRPFEAGDDRDVRELVGVLGDDELWTDRDTVHEARERFRIVKTAARAALHELGIVDPREN